MSIAIGAGQGTATAAAVLCGPPAHRANVALMPITPAEAIRSPGRTPLTPSTARLAGARLTRPTIPSRPNPHSARGTGLPHNSRVPSLEAFGRRPGACRAVAMGRHPKPFTSAVATAPPSATTGSPSEFAVARPVVKLETPGPEV